MGDTVSEAHGGHGAGHVHLGDLQAPPGGEVHSLPEGSVLAADGSTISWSQDATGTLTALGENSKQLVVSRYRPSKTAGTDVLPGGDLAVGDADPTVAGPGAGADANAAKASAGSEGEHDPISGMRFAYSEQVVVVSPGGASTVSQGDPYLTVTYVTDETDKSVSVNVVGLLSSLSIRMETNGDPTHIPGTVHAIYPHHQSAEWHGILDVTLSPVKMLTSIPGWRLYAFKDEFREAAYFDTLGPVVAKAFDQSDAPGLKPGVVAKDAWDIAAHAVAWGGIAVLVAAASATAPLSGTAIAIAFFGGAVASSEADLYDMAREELQQVEASVPPNPDVPDDEHPDDGCFAEGTVVALADSRYVPIERISVGDVVASREESSLKNCAGGVTRTWKHHQQRTVDIRLDTGERLRTTAPHRFFTLGRGIVPASELSVGDRLRTLAGSLREIVAIEPGPSSMTVYNLTVAGSHTYFVGDTAVWVHNDKDTQHDDDPPPDPDAGGDGDGGGGGAGDPSGGGSAPGGDGGGAPSPA
jgi:hypothetical protein